MVLDGVAPQEKKGKSFFSGARKKVSWRRLEMFSRGDGTDLEFFRVIYGRRRKRLHVPKILWGIPEILHIFF